MPARSVDAYGQVKINDHLEGNFRLIEVTPNQIALFGDDKPVSVRILDLEGGYKIGSMRKLTATLTTGESVLFTKAGCSCTTPASLRGPRSKFMSQLTPADA